MLKRITKLKEREELALLLFPLVFFLIAPLIHEYSHILFLEALGCEHIVKLSVFSGGGMIKPLCEMTTNQALFFLSVGLGMTFVFAFLFFIFARLKKENVSLSLALNSVGLGFFISGCTSLWEPKNDITTILQVLRIEITEITILSIQATAVILIILGIFYFWEEIELEERLFNREE